MSAQPPPYVPQQAPTMANPSPGPGRKWYVVAALVFVLIGGPALYASLQGLDGITNGLMRTPVPGQTEVELEPGTWTVFYEYSGEFEGVTYNSTRTSPTMLITVSGEDGAIPVTGSTGSFNYNIGGHAGFSIGQFKVDEPGTYTFEAALSDPSDTEEYLLALGKDLGKSTVLLAVGVVALIGAGAIALLIFLIVIIMRSRAKSRMKAAGYSV